MLTYSRYKFTRYWGVYEGDEMDPQETLVHIEALAREGLRISLANQPQN